MMPLSHAERTSFIHRKVASTIETLSDPEVNRVLNGSASEFIEELKTAEIAQVEDGIVHAPKDRTANTLAIIALRRGEVVKMDSYYFTQTTVQERLTKQRMSEWKPCYDIDTIYDTSVPDYRATAATNPQVVLAQQSLAMVGTSAAILSDKQGKSSYFSAAPEGILLLRHRPTLILGLNDDGPTSAGMIHELAHIAKANYEPIIVAKSQHSLNMHSLGEELEASGAGGPVALLSLQNDYRTNPEALLSHPDFLQIALDDVRRQYTKQYGQVNQKKPFQPSGMLLKMVTEHGLAAALHETLNFENIQRIASGEY